MRAGGLFVAREETGRRLRLVDKRMLARRIGGGLNGMGWGVFV